MSKVFNPYLPLSEYIPDGEPHVFGDRVYIYGSHDAANGSMYCPGDYEIWSAPVDDLSNWRSEGISYRRDQDPSNANGEMQLWAPDVTKGPDGKYYLYYCFNFYPEIGVAVSSSPSGPFSFLGHVKYPQSIRNGETLREFMPFDPAVLTDADGRVYLYYGFAPAEEKEMQLAQLSDEEVAQLPDDIRAGYEKIRSFKFGEDAMVAELEPDMITLKETPHALIPGGHHAAGTGFEGHAFFEASSIRHINDRYYFVYSSHKSHELCYAVSTHPDRGFVYGGTIISNGDIGLDGRTEPVNTLGNNHGGIEKIGENYYIFYHRQTNGTEFSRQGCAEKIQILPDGSIPQVEITSCGLNGGPLPASGSYPASIACHITSPKTKAFINYQDPDMQQMTRIREENHAQYIADVVDGSVIGYKYFSFDGDIHLLLELRGQFGGKAVIANDIAGKAPIGEMDIHLSSQDYLILETRIHPSAGKNALYLLFSGHGSLDIKNIMFA